MKGLSKALLVFTNLADYAVGITAVIILLLKKDFISIFYINGMSTNQSLFFNLILFQAGLALVSVVICLLANEYARKDIVVEFPVIYLILPIIMGLIGGYYGISGENSGEKAFVIIASVIYIALSAVVIYCGSRVFQQNPKENK